MKSITAMAICIALVLTGCATPPPPPSCDGKNKRPINAQKVAADYSKSYECHANA